MTRSVEQLAAEAEAAFRSGRHAEAIATYRKLLAAAPDRANDWFNLALLLRRVRDFRGAIDAYGEALSKGISGPEEVLLNRAVILSEDLREPEEALVELERAHELAPHYVPALLNLGNLYEDLGAREQAERSYARALEIEPHNPLALARLADVHRFASADDPLVENLRLELAAQNDPAGAADLGFALGRALDQCGDYDDAFAAYEQANRASAKLSGSSYDPANAAAFIDRIIENCSDAADRGDYNDASPVFICGMFRSGSTLAERILASHSRMTAGGELDLIPAIAAALPDFPEAAKNLSSASIERFRQFYLSSVQQLRLDPAGLTDKRPDNFLYVGLIKHIFPNAKIVHTRRDKRDNCLSVYFAHLDPGLTYAHSISAASHWYDQQERLFEHWKSLYPEDIFTLDYDALVSDPQPQVTRLLEFLGLDWDAACMTPHAGSGIVRTASAWQVREPLHGRSSGRWRNYERFVAGEFGRGEERGGDGF